MTDNEKLIEEAATAIRAADNDFDHSIVESARLADELWLRAMASAALAVFEKAHTPTDDEREALAKLVNPDAFSKALWWKNEDHARHLESNARVRAGEILAAGFRRSEVPEPSAEEWAERAQAAREKAIAKGYTPEHDAEHGIRHLLNWAIDYARRGRAEESSGMLLSAIALIDGANPGWSTDDRRSADDEAKRRFLQWPAGTGAINGFILGAEWWKLTHPVTPPPQGEPSDAPALDPQPWVFVSDQVFGVRSATDEGFHAVSGAYHAFQPRREYEQDRARYESAGGVR